MNFEGRRKKRCISACYGWNTPAVSKKVLKSRLGYWQKIKLTVREHEMRQKYDSLPLAGFSKTRTRNLWLASTIGGQRVGWRTNPLRYKGFGCVCSETWDMCRCSWTGCRVVTELYALLVLVHPHPHLKWREWIKRWRCTGKMDEIEGGVRALPAMLL